MKNKIFILFLTIFVFNGSLLALRGKAKAIAPTAIPIAQPEEEIEEISTDQIKTKWIKVALDKDGYPNEQALKNIVLYEFFLTEPKVFKTAENKAKYKAKEKFFNENLHIKSVDGGSYTDRIYAVSLKNSPPSNSNKNIIFLKISTQEGSSQRLIEMQQTFLRKLKNAKYPDTGKKIPQKDLPTICWIEKIFKYKAADGQTNLIEITHAAQGKPVDEIYSYGSLEEVMQCAQAMGKAVGSFQQTFMNYVNPKDPWTWTTVAHNDLHGNNVFFNEKTSRVYYIDNEMMKDEYPIERDVSVNISSGWYGWKDNIIQFDFIKAYIDSFPTIEKRQALAKDIIYYGNLAPQTEQYLDTIIYGNTRTPLETAVLKKDKVAVSQLIKNGANLNNINTLTEGHTSPLILAIKNYDTSMIEFLLSNGALTDLIFEFGKTALHFATELDSLKIVKMLLKAGANPSATDIDGNTPLSIAKKHDKPDIISALQFHIAFNTLAKIKNAIVVMA
ncbi:MAG: ankyrin repeat domain-containing protein [Candidatus Dependentiae bacterium]|nr:ankyrin repeat domain-containing protein [Candidatus Dependentiae bacterium]